MEKRMTRAHSLKYIIKIFHFGYCSIITLFTLNKNFHIISGFRFLFPVKRSYFILRFIVHLLHLWISSAAKINSSHVTILRCKYSGTGSDNYSGKALYRKVILRFRLSLFFRRCKLNSKRKLRKCTGEEKQRQTMQIAKWKFATNISDINLIMRLITIIRSFPFGIFTIKIFNSHFILLPVKEQKSKWTNL